MKHRGRFEFGSIYMAREVSAWYVDVGKDGLSRTRECFCKVVHKSVCQMSLFDFIRIPPTFYQ